MTILPTKITAPRSRPWMLRRESLVDLVLADSATLGLIIAPSGCGKSELLAQVVDAADGATAWLSLDPYDDDPSRFWAYLLAALESAMDESFDDLRARSRAPAVPLATSVVEPLLVRLGDRPLTIVIDDYHLIADDRIHDSVRHLIRHLPGSARLLLSSRTQPPFALARSRIHDDVLDIRAKDLALTVEEAKRLLEATASTEITDRCVAVIHERTEGWAAGLYLAGLSLQTAEDTDEFVRRFAGDDRNVAEYLAAEVLRGLDDDTAVFLREASILDDLTGAVCDHVLERSGSATRLRELALTNMLLILTDHRNERFRFHHLFRDWLQLELELADPERVPMLHQRAMEWYASRDTRLAGHHAVASGDPALAIAALVEWGTDLIDHGELATVSRWADAIPRERFEGDPSLAVMMGWMYIGGGRVDEIEPWLTMADTADERGKSWRSGMGRGDTLCLRAYRAMLAGDIEAAAAHADHALELVTWSRTGVAANLHRGIAAYWLGEGSAAEWLTEAASSAYAHPEPYAAIQATAFLALIARDERRAADSARLAAECQATIDEYRLHEFGQTAAAHLVAGLLALDEGAFDSATTSFDRTNDLARRIHSRPLVLASLLGRADAALIAGDRQAATEAVARAADELAQMRAPGTFPERLAVVERRVRRPGRGPAPTTERVAHLVEELTERELAVLRLLPGRLTQREIGEVLHLSMNTVKTHIRHIFRKLGVTSRDDAVEVARSLGLL